MTAINKPLQNSFVRYSNRPQSIHSLVQSEVLTIKQLCYFVSVYSFPLKIFLLLPTDGYMRLIFRSSTGRLEASLGCNTIPDKSKISNDNFKSLSLKLKTTICRTRINVRVLCLYQRWRETRIEHIHVEGQGGNTSGGGRQEEKGKGEIVGKERQRAQY